MAIQYSRLVVTKVNRSLLPPKEVASIVVGVFNSEGECQIEILLSAKTLAFKEIQEGDELKLLPNNMMSMIDIMIPKK